MESTACMIVTKASSINGFFLRQIRIVLFLFLPFLMIGCVSLSTVKVDVLRPAVKSIPPEIKTLVVVDNSSAHPDSIPVQVNSLNDSNVQYLENFKDTISNMVINSLVKELKKRKYFDDVYLGRSTLKDTSANSKRQRLTGEGIKEIKKKFNPDAILILNDFDFSPILGLNEVSYDYYYYSQLLIGKADWQLYSFLGDTLMDNYTQRDSMRWNSYMDEVVYPVDGIPTIEESLQELGNYMGFYYADRIAPYWEPVNRYYYYYNSGLFKVGADLANRKNWEEAEKVWFSIYRDDKKLNKARAAHNIALAKEMQGDFQDASKWAYESLALYEKYGSYLKEEINREKSYYKEITRRYLDKKKLQEQFGEGYD